jgi:hypothetical protein
MVSGPESNEPIRATPLDQLTLERYGLSGFVPERVMTTDYRGAWSDDPLELLAVAERRVREVTGAADEGLVDAVHIEMARSRAAIDRAMRALETLRTADSDKAEVVGQISKLFGDRIDAILEPSKETD